MTNLDLPIYLVALGDKWVRSLEQGLTDCALAFGNPEAAREFIRREAEGQGIPEALYRVVEYRFGGNVSEG